MEFIYNLLRKEIESHGGSPDIIMHKFKRFNDSGIRTWAVRKLCSNIDDDTVDNSLKAFSAISDIPYTKVKYSYFSAAYKPLKEILKDENVVNTLKVLVSELDVKNLWEELLPYCYDTLRNIAICILLEREFHVQDIEIELGVSQSYVYKVRKEYYEKEINSKTV